MAAQEVHPTMAARHNGGWHPLLGELGRMSRRRWERRKKMKMTNVFHLSVT